MGEGFGDLRARDHSSPLDHLALDEREGCAETAESERADT
jgi:hypothetical protein